VNRRRLAGLAAVPRPALVALGVGVVAIVALLWVTQTGGDGSGDVDGDAAVGSGADADPTVPSTTLNTGGIDVAAPDGWLAIPVPDLGFGLAVPPGWEASLLSPEGLATLASASPAVPGFVDSAHQAAASGGLVYAAGEDAAGGVSDVMVRGAPESGVADAAGLAAYARDLAVQAGRADPQVEVVEGATRPTVRMRFQVGGGGETAEGTETLVLGPQGIVWEVIVTSDDAASHDDLATGITDTLTFAGA
jgi:hypothetical protein